MSTLEKETYTKEEVEKLLQAEGDRRVTQALKKQEDIIAEKIEKAVSLAQLSEQERFEATLKDREETIKQRELELTLMENKAQGIKELTDRGLSVDLIDVVIGEDSEQMFQKIKSLEEAMNASVTKGIEERLKGPSPKQIVPEDTRMSKKEFSKLSLREKQTLYEQSPEEFSRLSE